MRFQPSTSASLFVALLTIINVSNALPAAEPKLTAEDQQAIESIAAKARLRGDARRGAKLFYTSPAACSKCHTSDNSESVLGPSISSLGKETTVANIVEAILHPSAKIRQGFESVTVVTVDGQVKTGLQVENNDQGLVLRELSDPSVTIRIPSEEVDSSRVNTTSLMPERLLDSLAGERDLLDLVSYVHQVAQGGPQRAAELRPSDAELLIRDDTQDLDHAGILRSFNQTDIDRGRELFTNHCQNCHGSDGNNPTLPTARAFGRQAFRFGADPLSMLKTLTKGAGLMPAMQHLSPRERYQVIHYVRESLMKPSNPTYQSLTDAYFADLPQGTSDGQPVANTNPRDYGPVLGSQLASRVNNGLTFQLSDDLSVCYDLHRMQIADVWTGGFLDLAETHHYKQRGEGMPQIDGEPVPGLRHWKWAYEKSFEIPQNAKPPRGPLRSDWMDYHGYYLYGDQAILSYSIHQRACLETIESEQTKDQILLRHTLRIEAGQQPLRLCVGQLNPPVDGMRGLISAKDLQLGPMQGKGSDYFAVVSGNDPSLNDEPRMANEPLAMIEGEQANELDLGTPERTVLVRFLSMGDGTLISSSPARGAWKPNGKTLFIRGQRLVFDIGWVGAMTSRSTLENGKWYTAALVVGNEATRLYIDGKLEAESANFRRPAEPGHVLKIGATATNFGGDLQGEIASIDILPGELSNAQLQAFAAQTEQQRLPTALFHWTPTPDTKRHTANNPIDNSTPLLLTALAGETDGLTWNVDENGQVILNIPANDHPMTFSVLRSATTQRMFATVCNELRQAQQQPVTDLDQLLKGGPQRWPDPIVVQGQLGAPINGYALDTIPLPETNPWNAWLRTSAVDFFSDGRAVVTMHGGDVFIVDGIDESLQRVTWKRYVAGLFEPFGVRVLDDVVYVTCRDGIKRLHDFNNDDEVDFVEAFWTDDDLSNMFHAYNFDLQSDSQGNLYFAKAGQYTQHHRPGTIMRVPKEGGEAEVVAWGLRTPNGMGKLADDRFTVSDNQGPWMPAGKISLIKPETFLGNMPINGQQEQWLKQRHGGELPKTFEQPLVWTPQELDNSCGGQVWTDEKRFGPLSGQLLHSSFGKGWLYYMSLQEVGEQTQASIVALPHQWDAGVMRLRVNPADGQLYGTGLSGWQGPAGGKDGCFQRLRYAGPNAQIVSQFQVIPDGIELTFSFDVDEASATDPSTWQAEMWNYLWSARYGSDQFSVMNPEEKGHDRLEVEAIEMVNSRTVRLLIPNLRVCNQLLLQMNLQDANGNRFIEQLYATINAIPTTSATTKATKQQSR